VINSRAWEALWPESSAKEHARELEPILAGKTPGSMPLVNFVAETADGKLFGFAEVDLRSHADGCSPERPVGYLEGWYVAEEARHSGIGRRLLSTAEDWARSHGCVEMASDTWIDNELSQTCHRALALRSLTAACTTAKRFRFGDGGPWGNRFLPRIVSSAPSRFYVDAGLFSSALPRSMAATSIFFTVIIASRHAWPRCNRQQARWSGRAGDLPQIGVGQTGPFEAGRGCRARAAWKRLTGTATTA